MLLPLRARAAAEFVYHEQSTNAIIAGAVATNCAGPQPYAEVLLPTPSQAFPLRFKVGPQSATDQARVYYTIDGSAPQGALGNGSNTTRVIAATYACAFAETNGGVDLCRAVIPAQPAGTTVKYIVSAWASTNGGNELFANGGTCAGCTPAFTAELAAVFEYTVASPPWITVQPASRTNNAGSEATFSVAASGTEPLGFQWFFNGTQPLPDATNALLRLANVQPAMAGNYTVVVTNFAGAVTSAVATLTVRSLDFGDAPASYATLLADDGARHVMVPGIYLGAGVDFEPDGQPDATAAGDDRSGVADEDGVTFRTALVVSQPATVAVVASTNGRLNAWIDFNRNGAWNDAGEQVFTNYPLARGTNLLNLLVPAQAAAGPNFARFRFSTAGGLSVTGEAPDGEVEDYAVSIQPAVDLAAAMSDQPDPVVVGNRVTYIISIVNNGPSPATQVRLTDPLPAKVSLVSIITSGGSCTNSGGTLTCDLGDLNPGASALVALLVRADTLGIITNVARVAAAEFEVNAADNAAFQATTVLTTAASFSNPATIMLPDILAGPGTPYPSTIFVSGLTATVYKVTATLHNVFHVYPDDLDILLVGPGGQTVMLMSDAGINYGLSGVTVTFDDAAPAAVPDSGQIVSGSYRPANYEALPDAMPALAPPWPYSASLAVFNGGNPNGPWSLYVRDDSPEDAGYVADGWSLNITTLEPIADLALALPGAPDHGAVLTNLAFTVTVTNFGPADASGVTVTDPLPAGLNFVAASASQGACSNANGTVRCDLGTLANGAGAVLTITLQPAWGATFTNTVSVAGLQLDLVPTNNTATTVITVAPVADLAVTGSPAPEPVLLEQGLTYTLVVSNHGPNTATGVGLSDALPPEVNLLSVTSSQGSCTNAGGLVTCALGSLAAQGRAIVTLRCRAAVLGIATNLATLTGDQIDYNAANNALTNFSTIIPAADLGMALSASPVSVPLGQVLTCTMTISNRGPNAATNVVLVEPLPANVVYVAATPAQGNCRFEGGVVQCDLGPLAVGDRTTVTLAVIPSSLTTITNTATVSSELGDPDPTNNTATVVAPVLVNANLAVSSTASRRTLWTGDSVTYTVLVTNPGPSAATGVVLSNVFPGSVTFLSYMPSQGTVSRQNNTITCNFGTLAVGGRATLTASLTHYAYGVFTNQSSVAANELDVDLVNNAAALITTVLGRAGTFTNLGLISVPPVGPATPYPSSILVAGMTAAVQQVRVVLTTLNHTYTDDLDILLAGPNGQAVMLMSDAGGEFAASGLTLTFDSTAAGVLPDSSLIQPGIYRPTDYDVGADLFPAPAPAGPYGTNLAVFNGIDPNGTWSLYVVDDSPKDGGSIGGWRLEIAARDPIAGLVLLAGRSPEPVAAGGNLTFTITVSNSGPAAATSVALTNQFSAGLSALSAAASQGSCSVTGNMVACDFGTMTNGNQVVVQVAGIPAAAGALTNVVTVSSRELDLNPANNVVELVTTVEDAPLILAPPENQAVLEGGNASFSVSASGTEPLFYQWQRNAAAIAGATNSTLELIGVTSAQAGNYRVWVSNRVGAALSAVARLIVMGPPNVTVIDDQVIDEDTATGWLPFVIGDVETPAELLIVTGRSLDPLLVPDANIVFGGSGSNRTVRVTPTPNRFGATSISVIVTDSDGGSITETFLLTVNPVPDPPAIQDIADQVTDEDTPAVVAFAVEDVDLEYDRLVITATSSQPELVPDANLSVSGSNSNRVLTLAPLPDQFGTTLITVTVTAPCGLSASDTFRLTVRPVNDPPTLAPINDLSLEEDAGPQTVPLERITAGPANEIQRLRVTAISSRPDLLPNPVVTYTSPETTGTLALAPATNATGSATITVTVHDGQATNQTVSRSLTVTILPVNDPPAVSGISDVSTDEDTAVTIPFALSDDGPLETVTLAASSSDPARVPVDNMIFGGSGARRTLTITPATNQVGPVTITVTATDTNGASADLSFGLTINPVNDAPTLAPLNDLSIVQNAGLQTVALDGIGSGAANETQILTVTAVSGNPALIPNPTVNYASPNPAGTLTFRPVNNATGTVTITVTVDDGAALHHATTRSFRVTVAPQDLPPVFGPIAGQVTAEDTPITVPFTVRDPDTPPFLLTLSGVSSNTNLVASASLFFDGSGTNRTVTVVPSPNQSGSAILTLAAGDGATNASTSFTLTVAPVNDRPTLDPLPDLMINESSGQFIVNLTGISSGAPDEVQALNVTATSSNTALITVQSTSYTTGSSTGSVRLRAASNGNGTAQVAVTVWDDGTTNNTFTRIFTVFVKPLANTAPTISDITDRTTGEDTPTPAIPFTVNDAQTAPGSLTVWGVSSNPTLVPNANLVFGGSGSNRTVTITPVANQSGAAVITISVRDASYGIASDTFVLTVNPVNDPPTISAIANQTIAEDGSTAVIPFTVNDLDHPAAGLRVTASSSDTNLVANDRILLGGSGANRALLITPSANQAGATTITVTVSDGEASRNTTFLLTVTPVNDPPVISAIADQVVAMDTSTAAIAFTVDDIDSPPASLTLSASSANAVLVPGTNIVFAGVDRDRTVTITPAPGQSGAATITVTVDDGNGGTASSSFLLTVNPRNNPPTLDPIADVMFNENAGVYSVPLTGISSGATNEAQVLLVTAAASDPTLIWDLWVDYISPMATGSVVLLPVPGVYGIATITVTVDDGQNENGLLTRSFNVTITAAPMIPDIPDALTDEDVSVQVGFTVSDLETAAGDLVVTATSSDPALVPDENLLLGGGGADRTLTLTPLADRFGTAMITVTVTDTSGASSQASFELTVNPVNDLPAISGIPDQVIEEDQATAALAFTVGDVETPADSLQVTGVSSNLALVPNENIVVSGSGTERTVIVQPATNQFGATLITLTVADADGGTARRSFLLTVNPVNDPPAIAAVPDQTTVENTPITVTFAIADADSPASNLTVTAASGNLELVPAANLQLGGSGPERTLTITPATNQVGAALITLTVTDPEGAQAGTSFELTVNQNHPPAIAPIPDQVTDEDQLLMVAFVVSDPDHPASNLVVSALSSNLVLVPASGLVLGGTGANRTLAITPAANRSGTNLITLTVSDPAGATATASFGLVVRPVNDYPYISTIPDQVTDEDTPITVNFTIGDAETPASALVLGFTSYNPALVPANWAAFGGSGSNRTLRLTPAPNAWGSARIEIRVRDGDWNTDWRRSTNLFTLVVRPVNDPPTSSAIPDQVMAEDGEAVVAFYISDPESPASNLVVRASAADGSLVAPGGLVLEGTGELRYLRVRPQPDRFGSTRISLVVQDEAGASVQTGFGLEVQPVNDLPSLSAIPDQETQMGEAVGPVGLEVGDKESGPEPLVLGASASNAGLVPLGAVEFGGSGAQRSLVVRPAPGQYGWAVVTVSVRDPEGGSTQRSFELTVHQTNGPPVIALEPQGQMLTNGGVLRLRVVATGPGPLSYRWQREGVDLAGQTNATLVLSPVSMAESGAYQVVVANGAGSVTSAAAAVRVYEPVRIVSISREGAGVSRLAFTTSPGRAYKVEYAERLGGSWTALGQVTGTGQVMSVRDETASGPARFYRVRME